MEAYSQVEKDWHNCKGEPIYTIWKDDGITRRSIAIAFTKTEADSYLETLKEESKPA